MNDEEFVIGESPSLDPNDSFDLFSLDAPEVPLCSVKRSLIEYDESEGFSDQSVSVAACKSTKQPSNIMDRESAKVRPAMPVSNKTTRASKTATAVVGKPRARIDLLQAENQNLQQEVARLKGVCSTLRQKCSSLENFATSASSAPTRESGTDASLCTGTDQSSWTDPLTPSFDAGALADYERLVEELQRVTDDRDRLKQLVKKDGALLAENEALRSALKERHPNTAFALLSMGSDETNFQAKLEKVDAMWERRINVLRLQHEEVKRGYEAALAASPSNKQASILQAQVVELEARIGSIKEYYLAKLQTSVVRKRQASPSLMQTSPVQVFSIGEVTVKAWKRVLKICVEHRADIVKHLSSFEEASPILRSQFIRCLDFLDCESIAALVEVYGSLEGRIFHNFFLADLAREAGVDLAAENTVLRTHVQTLLRELKDKVESMESGELFDTLQAANEQLANKEKELAHFKLQVGRLTQAVKQTTKSIK